MKKKENIYVLNIVVFMLFLKLFYANTSMHAYTHSHIKMSMRIFIGKINIKNKIIYFKISQTKMNYILWLLMNFVRI